MILINREGFAEQKERFTTTQQIRANVQISEHTKGETV